MSPNRKKVLLIVEDENMLRGILRDKLLSEGFEVLEAVDGEKGLMMALSEQPDLILLDIVLPVMDGMTMLRKLRQENEWGKQVPVIILTNLSSDDEQRNRDITELGPSHYLVKADWKLEDVVAKIRARLTG